MKRFLVILSVCAAVTVSLQALTPTPTSTPTSTPNPTLDPMVRTVSPDESIQSAINAAPVGGTILLNDGIYYEQVRITKPLTLRAKNGGRAVLSGASPSLVTFQKEGTTPGLYSASVPWKVRGVMDGKRNLIDYKVLPHLENFTFPPSTRLRKGSHPGPREGYVSDTGKLYVRLSESGNPTERSVEISRNHNGIGINVAADDVVIQGLRIHLWPIRGVVLGNGVRHTTVRDCLFTGTMNGIYAETGNPARKNASPPVHLRLEQNEFSIFPVYDYQKAGNRNTWRGLYDSNLGGQFIRGSMNGVTAVGNYVHDTFDAFDFKASTPPGKTTEIESEVAYNVIQNVVDNSLEFDTFQRFMNVRAHHNFLLDGYTHVSTSPFYAGKFLLDHNIFYTSPEYGPKGGGGWLKVCVPRGERRAFQGITAAHNTVITGDSASQDSHLVTCGNNPEQFYDSIIENNIIRVKSSSRWGLKGFTFSRHNLVNGSKVDPDRMPDSLHAPPMLSSMLPVVDFHLQSLSPAVGAGVNKDDVYHHRSNDGTDLGAIEYGDQWSFPRPGPSWVTNGIDVGRPPIPPSLNPSWVGLQ